MRRRITEILCAGLALSGLACDSDRPVPSGRLLRPSGLAYIERSPTRRDLFIADSEAQGILVYQLETVRDSQGRLLVDRAFVPAPAVFFPLVISAPGFPTKLLPSADGARIYALAPTTRTLYVIDARELPLGAPAPAGRSDVLLEVALEPFTEETGTPVSLELLPSAAGGPDIVLVAFDVLGAADGRLVALVFEHRGEDVALRSERTETVTVAPGPRAVAVHGSEVVVSSARSNQVSVVSTSTGSATVLGAERRVDVGGPTAVLTDAREMGVLAFRLDADQVVVLGAGASGLEVVTEVALRASPVADAAYGRLESLVAREPQKDVAPVDVLESLRGADGKAPVVALAHADARVSFLFPRSAEVPTPRVGEDLPVRISTLFALEGDAAIEECGDAASCTTPGATPSCAAGLVSVTSTGAGGLDLRATFQGPLALWRRSPSLEPMTERAPVQLSAETSTLTAVVDIDFAGLEGRLIQPGDVVRLQLEAPSDCAIPEEVLDLAGAGVVQGIEATRVRVEIPVAEAGSLGARLASAAACSEALAWFSYEIHPAGPEVVVASALGSTIDRVHRRLPVLLDGPRPIARLELDPEAPYKLNATLIGDLSCREVSDLPGAPCFEDNACRGGICEQAGACEGTCRSPECPEGVRGCLTREVARRCAAVQLTIAPPLAVETNLATSTTFVPGAPDDIVFDPQRPGFFVSFPGGREIVEAHVAQENRQVALDRIR